MKVVLIALVCCLTVGATPTHANEPTKIVGNVCEAETGKALENVYIKVIDGRVVAITDSVGAFVIEGLDAEHPAIIAMHVGYEPKQVTIVPDSTGGTQHLDTIYLSIKPYIVDGITVKAMRRLPYERPSVNTDRFLDTELKPFPGSFNDPTRFVQLLPSVQTSNDFRSDLIVRGGNPMETAMIVDGFEVGNLNHFGSQGSTGGPFGMISADNIKEINFSPGGYSVKYPNRLSSMMELKVKTARDYANRFNLTMDLTGVGISARQAGDRCYVVSSVRRSYFDAVKDQINVPSVPIFTDAFVKTGTLIGETYVLSVTGLIGFDHFSLPAGELPYDDGSLEYDQDQGFLGIKLISLESAESALELKYLLEYSRFDIGYSLRGKTNLYVNRSLERTHRLSFDYIYDLSEHFAVSCGLGHELSHNNYDLGIVRYVDEYGTPRVGMNVITDLDLSKTSSYIQFISVPRDALKLTYGLRHDYHFLLDRGLISPRVNVEYSALRNLTISCGFGLFGQPPSPLWLASDESNYNLPFFKATHLTAGLAYSPHDAISIRLEAYHKEYLNYPVSYSDSIRTMVDWGTDYRFYDTRAISADGSGYARGLELTLQQRIADRFNCLIGASLSTSRYSGISGEEIEGDFDTRYSLSGSFNYRPVSWLRTALRFVRTGGRPYTPVDVLTSYFRNFTYLDHARINEAYYPPYHRLDFRVETILPIRNGSLSIYIDVLNLYDRRNVYFYYWSSKQEEVRPYYQWKRLAIAGITVEF